MLGTLTPSAPSAAPSRDSSGRIDVPTPPAPAATSSRVALRSRPRWSSISVAPAGITRWSVGVNAGRRRRSDRRSSCRAPHADGRADRRRSARGSRSAPSSVGWASSVPTTAGIPAWASSSRGTPAAEMYASAPGPPARRCSPGGRRWRRATWCPRAVAVTAASTAAGRAEDGVVAHEGELGAGRQSATERRAAARSRTSSTVSVPSGSTANPASLPTQPEARASSERKRRQERRLDAAAAAAGQPPGGPAAASDRSRCARTRRRRPARHQRRRRRPGRPAAQVEQHRREQHAAEHGAEERHHQCPSPGDPCRGPGHAGQGNSGWVSRAPVRTAASRPRDRPTRATPPRRAVRCARRSR